MKRKSTLKDELDIPELARAQLGQGVRGKYFKRMAEGSNVVVLDPENSEAFPTSEAVNDALSKLLIFTRDTQRIFSASSRRARRAKMG